MGAGRGAQVFRGSRCARHRGGARRLGRDRQARLAVRARLARARAGAGLVNTPERLRQVRALFDSVMNQPTAEREAYLDRITETDPALRQEVRELLAALTDDGGAEDRSVGMRLGPY